MDYSITLLGKAHSRSTFDCGNDELNLFIARYAMQNQKKNYSKTYVISKTGSNRILGFYTLTSAEMNFTDLPEDTKHPQYPVSSVRICRLAVADKFKGKSLGKMLLKDALLKSLNAAEIIGIFSVIVDAKDDSAKSFYRKFGFLKFKEETNSMFLPIKTISQTIK